MERFEPMKSILVADIISRFRSLENSSHQLQTFLNNLKLYSSYPPHVLLFLTEVLPHLSKQTLENGQLMYQLMSRFGVNGMQIMYYKNGEPIEEKDDPMDIDY